MFWKKVHRGKRAVVGLYITFFIMAVLIVVIAGVLAPMGVLFNARMMEAGVDILNDANVSISNIDDAGVRSAVRNVTEEAIGAGTTNIEMQSDLFQYSWVFIVVLAGIVVFMITRRLVEYGGGGFV